MPRKVVKRGFKKFMSAFGKFAPKKAVRKRSVSRTRARTPVRRVKRKVLKKRTVLTARSSTMRSGHTSENFIGDSKRPDPTWFKTLTRYVTPSNVTGGYVGQIFNNANNTKVAFTHWLEKGIYELQTSLNFFGNNSVTVKNDLSYRQYMRAFTRTHEWRNSMNTSTEVELYVLRPRRDIPLYMGVTGGTPFTSNRIAPTATSTAQTGAHLVNPEMYFNGFNDTATGPDAGITSTDMAATPYMCAPLTQAFKVVPLKVRWPNGQIGHKGTLEAGQTLRLQVTKHRPYMVSYNKFGITGESTGASLTGTYQLVKDTPLIFGYTRGTLIHDAESTGVMGTSESRLDYSCQTRWELYSTQFQPREVNRYTGAFSSIAAPEQVVPVTGALTTVNSG